MAMAGVSSKAATVAVNPRRAGIMKASFVSVM
jgi:hypothetical protein